LVQGPLLRRYEYAFQIKLVEILGLAPPSEHFPEDAASLLASLLHSSWEDIARLEPSPAAIQSARRLLRHHLLEQFGKFPD
jgi:hypothetical protein